MCSRAFTLPRALLDQLFAPISPTRRPRCRHRVRLGRRRSRSRPAVRARAAASRRRRLSRPSPFGSCAIACAARRSRWRLRRSRHDLKRFASPRIALRSLATLDGTRWAILADPGDRDRRRKSSLSASVRSRELCVVLQISARAGSRCAGRGHLRGLRDTLSRADTAASITTVLRRPARAGHGTTCVRVLRCGGRLGSDLR